MDLKEQISKAQRRHGGKIINPTIAELQNARKGMREQRRDAMLALLSKGAPDSGITSQIGKIRRIRRRRGR